LFQAVYLFFHHGFFIPGCCKTFLAVLYYSYKRSNCPTKWLTSVIGYKPAPAAKYKAGLFFIYACYSYCLCRQATQRETFQKRIIKTMLHMYSYTPPSFLCNVRKVFLPCNIVTYTISVKLYNSHSIYFVFSFIYSSVIFLISLNCCFVTWLSVLKSRSLSRYPCSFAI